MITLIEKVQMTQEVDADAKFMADGISSTGHVAIYGIYFDFNMKLSQARADAVVKVHTTKYKINPQRLKAYGVGQLTPMAPNKNEEGRAKNRRVKLVEQ